MKVKPYPFTRTSRLRMLSMLGAIFGSTVIALATNASASSTATVESHRLLASVEVDDLLSASIARQKQEERMVESTNRVSNDATLALATGNDLESLNFKLDERALVAELRLQLARQFAVRDDFRVFLERPWKDLTLPTPDWELVITSFPAQGLRSQFFLRFEIWANGKRHTSWQEGLRCELWAEAYTATQSIERGAPLRSGLFVIQPVNVLALFQSPVEIGTPLGDYVVATGIQSGDPLSWRDLAERPLILRNSIIDVVASEGSMRIILKGKAMETGVRGQTIRVRNLQSASDIQAEVTGVNQARVYF